MSTYAKTKSVLIHKPLTRTLRPPSSPKGRSSESCPREVPSNVSWGIGFHGGGTAAAGPPVRQPDPIWPMGLVASDRQAVPSGLEGFLDPQPQGGIHGIGG